MPALELSLLGSPRIALDDVPVHFDTRKAIALLAYLALTGGQAQRDRLVTLLWSRSGRAQGGSALRRTLSTLRSRLGAQWFETQNESVRLCASPDLSVDALRFKALHSECAQHRHDADLPVCARCLPLLTGAAELYRGEFLSGYTLKDSVDFDDWQSGVTDAFSREYHHLLYLLALCRAASGQLDGAIRAAAQRLHIDPFDESSHELLMKLFAWSGNRSAAIRQYGECRRLLRDELDTEPAASTERLFAAIRAGRIPPRPSFAASMPAAALDARMAAEFSSIETSSFVFSTVFVVQFDSDAPVPVDGRSARPAAPIGTTAEQWIIRFGGEPHRITHGRLIGLFCNPVSSESNAELAVRAALQIRREALPRGITTRMAIDSEYRTLERADRTTRGGVLLRSPAVVGVLARVAKLAPNTIVAGEYTFRATRRSIIYHAQSAADTHLADGGAYRVDGARYYARKSSSPLTLGAPFVGRREELHAMVRALERATRGEGQVVLLSGEAGIGKSRLIDRLVQDVTEHPPDSRPLWLQARSISPSIDVPYLLVDDLLKPYIEGPYGFAEGRLSEYDVDFFARTRDAIRRVTKLPAPEIDEIAAELSRLTSLEPVDEPRKRCAYAAVIRMIRALASSLPVVIVFDDLQWADEPSFELVHTLIRELRGSPTLIVCAYRDEHDKRCQRLAATATRHRSEELTEVRLHRLASADSARLLDYFESKLGENSPDRAELLRRAEGNPLFLEELVSGATGRRGAATPSVPARIKSLLWPEFLMLRESHRELLASAAAIGSTFSKRLLASLHGGADVDALLDELEQRGFVVVDNVIPEVTVSFRQLLMHELILENTPETHLSSLRRRIAAEHRRPADDQAETVRPIVRAEGRVPTPGSSPHASARARARRTEVSHP